MRDSKRQLVQSRLRKRLAALGLDSYRAYHDHLQTLDKADDEMIRMINCITTNKTSFFREYHHFEFMRDVMFPEMIAQSILGGPKKLRIWSAACSMGEEPYSIAMTIHDCFADETGWDIRILASDIDTEVLAHAEAGIYEADRMQGIPNDCVRRHFSKQRDGSMKVKPHLRDLVTFRRINFADNPWPINTQFDLIICRNAMIYFDDDTQDQLLRRFSEYIPADKHLILGHSESMIRAKDLYKPVGKTTFIRIGGSNDGHLRNQVTNHRTQQPRRKPAPPRKPIASNDPIPKSVPKKPIIVGEVFASREPTCVTTLLGSCIAACLYDEDTKVGGMNHFLLPDGSGGRESASYGVHAMELLINEIMKLGGDRRRLRAKVFGGAHVIRNMRKTNSVGDKNAQFVKNFLETESIPVVSEFLGGESGLQVQFFTDTGRARIRKIERRDLPVETVATPPPVAAGHTADDDDGITLF